MRAYTKQDFWLCWLSAGIGMALAGLALEYTYREIFRSIGDAGLTLLIAWFVWGQKS